MCGTRKTAWAVAVAALAVGGLLVWYYFCGPFAPPVFVKLSDEVKEKSPAVVTGPGGARPDKVEALHGWSLERVRAELGEPNHMNEFSLRDADGEFRVE